jgi:spore coat polysaccharide biosynthesis protein SpsF (cytidylyltransferase family)
MMDPFVVGIVQARMGSTRLPGKTLIDICGQPLLAHILHRVSHARRIQKLVVATTTLPSDDAIVALCGRLQIPSFRGSDGDVLDRYYQCARIYGAEVIVRITADDPFKDPEVIDLIITELLKANFDYVSNTIEPTYPEGLDIEVFSFAALERAWQEARLPSEREHVTPYIWKHPEIFKSANIRHRADLSHLRWTLDYEEDLRFTREVYARLHQKGVFLMNDILALLQAEPELSKINQDIEPNAGYKVSL